MAHDPKDLAARIAKQLQVKPGTKVTLPSDHFRPGATAHFENETAALDDLSSTVTLLSEFQAKLAAQSSTAVLVVLQALDAAGKDGAVKHVMTGLNPSGVTVHSFKVPTDEERQHDFLWRCVVKLPRRGEIGIFNRSHYEDVLAARIHPEFVSSAEGRHNSPPEHIWQQRFREINDWERYLVDNQTVVVKIFLNISKAEQKRRFLERIDNPRKNWKFSAADVAERRHWDQYMTAYSEALTATSTETAPWHVVPADHKWFARLGVASILAHVLVTIDPRYPRFSRAQLDDLEVARQSLLEEPDV